RRALHLVGVLCRWGPPPAEAARRRRAGIRSGADFRRRRRRAFGGWIAPVRPRASAWIVVAAAVLAGCAIGPDYKRPAVMEPETFRGQATAEAASLADAAWWEVFQDPIRQALIREALRNNYDVR